VQLEISRHGEQRVRERLGLPRRAVRRTVERAWTNGVPARDAKVTTEYEVNRIWGGFCFVFGVTDAGVVLVTVRDTRTFDERRTSLQGLRISKALTGKGGSHRKRAMRRLGLREIA